MIRTNCCNPNLNRHKGMTLIEIILVVAIIGILAAITYPNYSDYIRKGHRRQAMADMAKVQLYLEENYNNGYSADKIMNNGKCGSFCKVNGDRYEIAVTISHSGYVISATPSSLKDQYKDSCLGNRYTKLTLSHTGESLPLECWM